MSATNTSLRELELTAPRGDLIDALRATGHAIGARPPVPVLGGVLIEVHPHRRPDPVRARLRGDHNGYRAELHRAPGQGAGES